MKSIEGILKLAENEFDAIVNNGKFRSREEIDSVYKLMDIVKDAHCIWKYEEEEESGYSEMGGSYDGSYEGGSYRGGRSYRGSYDGGMSMARGRGPGDRRDSMGRYSRDGSYDGGSYRGSYRGGYSRADAKQDYIEELHEMMEKAPDDQARQSIQRMIQQMEQS